jgi:hypothetical protein
MESQQETKKPLPSVGGAQPFYKKISVQIGVITVVAVVAAGGFVISKRSSSGAPDSVVTRGSFRNGERPDEALQGMGQGRPQGGGQGRPQGGGPMNITSFVDSDGSIKENELRELISNVPADFKSRMVSMFTQNVEFAEADGSITEEQANRILSIINAN